MRYYRVTSTLRERHDIEKQLILTEKVNHFDRFTDIKTIQQTDDEKPSLVADSSVFYFTSHRTKYFEILLARIGSYGFAHTRKPTHWQNHKSQSCLRSKDRVQHRKQGLICVF